MPIKTFVVPVADELAEQTLNVFLAQHRVLGVERRWVEQGASSYWAFCVDFLPVQPGENKPPTAPRNKVDYKAVLSTEDFSVYAKLREWRKALGQSEAVPVYAIFTNDQLAQIVQTRAQTRADLDKIAGLGDARLDKYGARLLELLATCWQKPNETNGPTV